MKKLIDNLAFVMVIVLFLVIVVLVFQYNTISENTNLALIKFQEEKTTQKDETKNYLDTLESYSDVDVQVDPTKETHKNTVKITSELAEDDLEEALKTDEKKNYLKSLESYSDSKKSHVKTEKLEDVKPEKVQNNDTIGDELDSILGE
jgi:preprotein translocase subunit SecF